MKTHLASIRMAAAAAVVAASVGQAAAQYTPYGHNPVPPGPQTVPPGAGYAVPNSGYPSHTAQQPQQPAYPAAQQPSYTAYRPQAAPAQPSTTPYSQYPATQYPATAQAPYRPVASQPRYPAVANQPQQVITPNGEPLPPPQGHVPSNGTYYQEGYPQGPSYHGGHHSGGHHYSGETHGYPSHGYPGRDTPDYGVGQYIDSDGGGSQWFGGVYALYMNRSNPGYRRLTIFIDDVTDVDYPYYPPANRTVNDLRCSDQEHDFREGLEVRFGSTFSVGGKSSCDYGYGYGHGSYNCSPCQTYAWEVGWWGIDGDVNTQSFIVDDPAGDQRIYGMVNYAGLNYDGWEAEDRPVNHYYDHQIPVNEPGEDWPNGMPDDVRVTAQRVRTNFRAQNLELNFLRLPLICCDPCDPCGGSSGFSVTTLCGVRYFRIRDQFEFGTTWGRYAEGPPATVTPEFGGWTYENANELYHDIDVKNQLVGFQLGANMNYCISCKWNVFWDSNFGVYNNHINHYQRIYGPGGDVYFTEELRDATTRSTKDTIAFLGEMRIGGSYDITCNWRAVAAYRAVAISGVALAPGQIADEYSNWADMSRIDASDSLIIHGVQLGVECLY